MPSDLNLFAIAGAKARHAVLRQARIAENIANADTPGYRARDIEPFAKSIARLGARGAAASPREISVSGLGIAAPDGNTVSVEDQMMRSGQAARDHEIATTLYAKSLAMLRAALGGRR